VQAFSEYAAWVRTRAVESRDYWTMRGWWMPAFSWLDDPGYPRHKTEQMKVLSIITANVTAAPEVWALNQRAYDRYPRYSFAFDQKNFKLDFTDGVLAYKGIKGSRASGGPGGGGPVQGAGGAPGGWMQRYPNVTISEGSTEAPDETAHGDWMKLVAAAGLQWGQSELRIPRAGKSQGRPARRLLLRRRRLAVHEPHSPRARRRITPAVTKPEHAQAATVLSGGLGEQSAVDRRRRSVASVASRPTQEFRPPRVQAGRRA
jgi:hypothetical protein